MKNLKHQKKFEITNPKTRILLNADREVVFRLLRDGSIKLDEKDQNAQVEVQIINVTYRTNPKKPTKPYLKYYANVTNPFGGVDSDFNHLTSMYAVDTSYKYINIEKGIKICVSITGKINLQVPNEYQTGGKFVLGNSYIFLTRNENPELIGLHWLVHDITNNMAYNSKNKIGIVVDTEYGKLDSFNKKEFPYLGIHYLPDNFELIYATSDSPGQHLANKMLRICDKESKKVMKLIQNEIIDADKLLGDKLFYIHKRIEWNDNFT